MRHHTSLRCIDAVARAGSIRAAAEQLALTSTALNRRILAFEEELGVAIFERTTRGVRLSSAGEIVIHHIRNQLSDMERVRSQIADLSGFRRGQVAIACSQALLPYFLPRQITAYREQHPLVRFTVLLRDRDAAERALAEHSADLAIVFEPLRLSQIQSIVRVHQPVCAVVSAKHPLASCTSLRRADCLDYPLALPARGSGVRKLLDAAEERSSIGLEPMIESDSFEFLRQYVDRAQAVTFQIPIGLDPFRDGPDALRAIPLDTSEVPPGMLFMGQLRDRTLPVAAARFAQQLVAAFADHFEVS